jgi:hypothetical protein
MKSWVEPAPGPNQNASAAAASLPILPLDGSTGSLEQTAAIMAAAVGLGNRLPGFALHELRA